jgi:DNA-binding NarL/FixJ family response regulator
MNEKIKLIIVDDHLIFREGLRKVLSESELLEIIGEASNGIEFLNLLENFSPDVVLMDIAMPEMDGIEATRKAITDHPDLKIIGLSMYGDQEYYYKMVHAGVKGFVLKKSGKKELEAAIFEVAKGEYFFSNELLRNIILNLSPEKPSTNGHDKEVKLTKRETEVLHELCKGLTNSEIAENLCISQKTIDTHRLNILAKTGSKNTFGLVMYAIKNKIVEI